MKKLIEAIEEGKKKGALLLMGHVVAGYPNYTTSLAAAKGICKGGAAFLEVQFPFSDPCADGPVIESACYKSLENGFTAEQGFRMVHELTSATNTAIIIMTYANIIFRYGIEKFITKAQEAGCSALIVPDLPPEQDEDLKKIANAHGIGVIFIAAPGAAPERIKFISEKSDGLLYTVARRGITGNKTAIVEETFEWITTVQANSLKPVALGFGIQSKEQTAALQGKVPIVVAGSYFVNTITALKANDNPEIVLEKAAKSLF